MTAPDYIVLALYVAGVFVIGGMFGKTIRTSRDMFAAGGRSPWWVSGLSGFMTMFSAGTFVVWGGIAYKHGFVAISISLCYGVAALATGWLLAGRWRATGVTTAAEFIELRFGRAALQFYTWTGVTYKMVTVGVALYSVAVLVSALIPLPDGVPFRDPLTGNLSLMWAVIMFGGIVVVYTVIGGLWAVLMTDVLQFIVLTLAVAIVAPLILAHGSVGGIGGFLAKAPEGFLSPTFGEFTWFFLAGWAAIHVFIIGGEWAFVQRFLCVPTERDARKSAWLFGALYLTSPVLWMLPPMVYRVINPHADPKEAYILACREVLPPGVVGLMIAAMFSATASMVDSQLNVFSGVLTRDFYRGILRPDASEDRLVRVGRLLTMALGIVLIAIALSVPRLGGAENVVLSVTSLIVVPLLAPSVWGLLSKTIDGRAVWWTASVSFAAGAFVQFGMGERGLPLVVPHLKTAALWLADNNRLMQQIVGVALPVAILAVLEWRGSGEAPGWRRLTAFSAIPASGDPGESSGLPAKMAAWTLILLGAMMAVLSFPGGKFNAVAGAFAGLLLAVGTAIFFGARHMNR